MDERQVGQEAREYAAGWKALSLLIREEEERIALECAAQSARPRWTQRPAMPSDYRLAID